MNQSRNNRQGFTLIETLVATAITLMAISAIYSIYASGQEAFDTKSIQADLQASGRLVMNRMICELRLATRTSTQNPSPNLVIPSTPNNKQVDFYLPQDKDSNGYITDASGDVEWDTNSKVQYQYVPGQKELRRTQNSAHETFATNVTDIQFIDQTVDSSLYQNEVKILMSLARGTKKRRNVTMNFTGIVHLRN